MTRLSIGLDSWIIQDGNYSDFHRDQDATFALEYPLSARISRNRKPLLEHIEQCRYRVNGCVIFENPGVWVLDFGVKAYENRKPPPFAKSGTWIEGEISIGIDPFFYFEELNRIPNMPKLLYNWRIDKITLDTTPWIEFVREGGGINLERDISRQSFRELEKTDAWKDDAGRSSYLLECIKQA